MKKEALQTMKLATLRAPVTIKASADGEPPGPPTFAAVAYSGGPVPGYTANPPLPHSYVLDLAGMTQSRSPKANLDHKTSQRVGHLTGIVNDGKELNLAGVLSAATAYRDEVSQSALGGFDWDVSIEGNLSAVRKIAAGKTELVNGRTIAGPVYVIGKTQLTGVAFVSQGADEGNQVTIAASAAGEIEMSDFEKFALSCGVDLDSVTGDHRANLQLAFDAKQMSGKPPLKTSSFAQIAADERSENSRRDEIHRMAFEAMRTDEGRLHIDQIENAVAEAIESKMSTDQFELSLLRNLRTRTGTFSSALNRDVDERVIEAAICLAAGLPNIEKHFPENVLHAVEKNGMRNFGLQQLLIQVANKNGYICRPGERITNGNLRTILEYCFPPATARMASGFSTISLPGILGNVANKELLAGYMEEDQTWRDIAAVKPVNSFHAVTSFRMLDDLEYEEVGPDGEIKSGKVDQESYTRQAKTYAKMLGLTRHDIINDDLGAFDDLRTRLGRGAAKKFNNIFWSSFMNNASFFTTALTNYIEGATTNLGVDGVGLELGVSKYRKMTTPSADGSKRVGASMSRPSILLVPPELEFTADRLHVSANVNTGGAATAQTVPNANIHVNKYRPVIQNRLSDLAFTGNSATAWYLFGNELKPMVVSFLNGQQQPTVESTDADFNVLGILFRGFHDFGADKSEYLAGVKSKGAA